MWRMGVGGVRLELTPEQREAAMRELENHVGPNLAGAPHLPRVYFGGAVDAIIFAINNPDWSIKVSDMAEVLAEHGLDMALYLITETEYVCICGKRSSDHYAHQAAALSAAGFGPVQEVAERVGKRYAKHHQMLRDELQAQAWDEGYTTGNSHNGRRDANPYRTEASS